MFPPLSQTDLRSTFSVFPDHPVHRIRSFQKQDSRHL